MGNWAIPVNNEKKKKIFKSQKTRTENTETACLHHKIFKPPCHKHHFCSFSLTEFSLLPASICQTSTCPKVALDVDLLLLNSIHHSLTESVSHVLLLPTVCLSDVRLICPSGSKSVSAGSYLSSP